MKHTAEEIASLFSDKGLKITPQRRLIIALLSQTDIHPTIEFIYQLALETMPTISRTTVCNTIGQLVALGELGEVEDLSGNGKRYDPNPANHHHLFCVKCRALVDVVRDFEGLDLPAEAAAGYRILKSHVTFHGLCPKCRNT